MGESLEGGASWDYIEGENTGTLTLPSGCTSGRADITIFVGDCQFTVIVLMEEEAPAGI